LIPNPSGNIERDRHTLRLYAMRLSESIVRVRVRRGENITRGRLRLSAPDCDFRIAGLIQRGIHDRQGQLIAIQ